MAAGYEIGQITPVVETAINEYLLNIRKLWAKPVVYGGVEYAANVYRAQIVAAIVGVAGVLNVEEVKLNNAAQDLILTETGIKQEVPVLGTVILNVAA